MFKKGPIYTYIAAQFLRYVELLVPLPLLIYGFLVQTGVINNGYKVNVIGFYILMLVWFLIGLLQFFIATTTKKVMLLRNIALHLMIGSYLLFVTGISSPVAYAWTIMTVSAYILMSTIGAIYNILIFVAFILIDFFFLHTNSASLFNNMLTLLIILATGSTIISMFQTQKVSQEKLAASKASEYLQRDRILTIVNSITDAILSIDMNGIIRVYNAASLNLLDTNTSLSGRHIDEILPLTNQKGESINLFKEFQTAKTFEKRDDLNYKLSDGELIRLEITYAPIHSTYTEKNKSKAGEGYVMILRDVTKSKSLEEERDEFVSVTSHELRTPIAIIEGTVSNLQVMLDHPDITNKMLKDAVNTTHEQIIFLANIVNDLSELSRADRDIDKKPENIDVLELAHKMHDKYIDKAKAKKLHIDLDLSPKLDSVFVSRLYLEELLQNIIINAIKYTKKGSVTIIFQQKGKKILFAIKDTGIGISIPDQSKVFGKFFRSEDYRTRETGGTGLGLYIAAKLAHKIGTKIDLTSRLNFGSTFSFSLPVKSDEETITT